MTVYFRFLITGLCLALALAAIPAKAADELSEFKYISPYGVKLPWTALELIPDLLEEEGQGHCHGAAFSWIPLPSPLHSRLGSTSGLVYSQIRADSPRRQGGRLQQLYLICI